MELKTVLITQARTGSSRLPGKILKKVNGKELLRIHLGRLKKSRKVDQIMVATTVEQEDQKIVDLVKAMGLKFYRGSEGDVLDRFYQAIQSLEYLPEWVVRVTSDCPLLDPALVDQVIEFTQKSGVDYVGTEDRFPDGQDVEVFKYSALEKAWREAEKKSEREHVTPYIRTHSNLQEGSLFAAKRFSVEEDYSQIRMTVDEPEDLVLITRLIEELGTDRDWLSYTNHIIKNNLSTINGNITRNEGYIKSIKNDEDA